MADTSLAAVDAANLGGYSGDLSVWGLFMMADPVVKAVMIGLILMSIWSWALIISKRNTLKRLNKRADKFDESFWSGEPLDKIYQRVKNAKPDPLLNTFSAGMEEWQAGISAGLPSKASLQAGRRQRVERAMSVAIGRESDRLTRGLTFLATTGAIAPFVGLFGTVWGIKNAFEEIALQQSTNLAVVAPGIAEALLATALGLLAAIPAVIFYNKLNQDCEAVIAGYESFADEFSMILSRQLDQAA